MRPLSSFVCLAAVLATFTTVQAAETADKTASKNLIRQGNTLLDKGKFQPALDKFEQAYRRFQSPKIFFNQAQALHGLERNLDALLAYQRFLSEAKDAASEVQAEARQQIADLMGKVGRVDIRSNRQGALVRIDGKALGTAPLAEPAYVEPGNHSVTLEWQGEQKSLSIAAAAGALATAEAIFDPRPGRLELASNREGAVVRIDEKAEGKTPLVAPPVVAPGEHTLTLEWQGEKKSASFTVAEGGATSLVLNFEDRPPVAILQPTPPAPEPRSWYRSRWLWVAGGAAVAAVATTLIVVYASHDRYPNNTFGTQPIGN
jgi:tetratricopeptide (TPR) repeat protein